MRRPNIRLLALALPVAACLAAPAVADSWPSRPVKMIVAGAPGSAPDVICRIVGNKLSGLWGQQVIVDNRPGAAGNLGTEMAARATPDGYTLLFGQAAPLSLNRWEFKSLPFDPERDFAPVANVGLSPMMIVVSPNVPAANLSEFIALAKEKPGKLSFGTSSSRNIPHLTGELLKKMAGINIVHVSYRSNAQAIQDVESGDVQMMIDGIPVLVNQAKDGRVRALAVSSPKRLPGLESIPTVAETLPGYAVAGWFAILAPAGTPADIVARVNKDVNAVLAMPDVVERVRQLGVYPDPGTPEDLAKFIKADSALWQSVVKAAGIEPE